MVTLDSGREVVGVQTYHLVEQTPVSLMQFLTAVPRGMDVKNCWLKKFIFAGSF